MDTELKDQAVVITELEDNYKKEIVEHLNSYLSNIQIAYSNVRGFHWNITGRHFFVLHEKFESIYNKLNAMADEIAERILMLDGKPVHAFSEYLKIATVKERTNLRSAEDTVRALLDDTTVLLENERRIIAIASDNGDEATANLVTDYVEEQEKLSWMLNAFLK